MKRRSVILILLIVGIPLGLLTWAAVKIAGDEHIVVQQQFHGLMEQRLDDVRNAVERHFQDIEARLQTITDMDDPETGVLRERSRREPLVMQMFVLAPDGRLEYPDPSQPLNSDEKSFLLRTSRIFTEQHLSSVVEDSAGAGGEPVADPASVVSQNIGSSDPAGKVRSAPQPEFESNPTERRSGWFVWYWDGGLNLIYWNRRPSGRIIGTALDRPRWMADLIGFLPDQSSGSSQQDDPVAPRIRLVNAASETVYQWGSGTDRSTEPVCEIPLAAPLSSWRLQCLVAPGQFPGQSRAALLGLAGGLFAAAIAVAGATFALVRDYTRDLREAGRQVSFVNQVSHELKTPLTNICLYAELLEKDLSQLPDENRRAMQRRLDVILGEGQRLSRLIGNVLTFALHRRDTLEPNCGAAAPDDVIRQVLKHFRPGLDRLGIDVGTQFHASQECRLDTDFLEQILGNLISNVEKYAAGCRQMLIASHQHDERLTVEVIDDGPGIAVRDRQRVFEPFVRLSHDISSAAGTGIGLSIARELARRHGGDVRLLDSSAGCHFEVTLQVG